MTGKGTILVVDDTLANLKLLADTLMAEGYQVLPSDSGELALASAAVRPPELILLDIRMPGLNGFEVFRRLKARPETCDIPVMFISAGGEVEERVEGLALGAVDFITKPFQRAELLARVQTHLELRRLRVRLQDQAAELRRTNDQLQTELVERKAAEAARERILRELQRSLAEVKTLQGIIPICAGCKKIRDDRGYWSQVETYIVKHSEAQFSHGMCPDCVKKWYLDLEQMQPPDPVPAADSPIEPVHRILLVEPDPVRRESLRQVLERGGYAAETAADGMEAAQALTLSPAGFGLVVMAQNMPLMDGVVILRSMRHIQKDIQIIFLTEVAGPGIPPDVQAHVRACLCKPFTDEQLLAAVKKASYAG